MQDQTKMRNDIKEKKPQEETCISRQVKKKIQTRTGEFHETIETKWPETNREHLIITLLV